MIPRASVLITTELDSDVGTLGGLCAARGAVRSSLDPVKVMPGAPPRARMVTNCIRTVHVDTQDLGKCMGSGKWVGHDPSGAGWPGVWLVAGYPPRTKSPLLLDPLSQTLFHGVVSAFNITVYALMNLGKLNQHGG